MFYLKSSVLWKRFSEVSFFWLDTSIVSTPSSMERCYDKKECYSQDWVSGLKSYWASKGLYEINFKKIPDSHQLWSLLLPPIDSEITSCFDFKYVRNQFCEISLLAYSYPNFNTPRQWRCYQKECYSEIESRISSLLTCVLDIKLKEFEESVWWNKMIVVHTQTSTPS